MVSGRCSVGLLLYWWERGVVLDLSDAMNGGPLGAT